MPCLSDNALDRSPLTTFYGKNYISESQNNSIYYPPEMSSMKYSGRNTSGSSLNSSNRKYTLKNGIVG